LEGSVGKAFQMKGAKPGDACLLVERVVVGEEKGKSGRRMEKK
jgi:hypothetical protein